MVLHCSPKIFRLRRLYPISSVIIPKNTYYPSNNTFLPPKIFACGAVQTQISLTRGGGKNDGIALMGVNPHSPFDFPRFDPSKSVKPKIYKKHLSPPQLPLSPSPLPPLDLVPRVHLKKSTLAVIMAWTCSDTTDSTSIKIPLMNMTLCDVRHVLHFF